MPESTQGGRVTIYDVPVEDTVFFPVSGDTMRQMKHNEERRNENGTGSPARNSPDAADLNHHQGEQTTMYDTAQSTADHGQVDYISEYAAGLTIIDGGETDLGMMPSEDENCDIKYALKAVLNSDTDELTIIRNERQHLTADFSVRSEPMPVGDEEAEIRRFVAERVFSGSESTEFLFTRGLHLAFERARSFLVCPEGCTGIDCLQPVAMCGIEHSLAPASFSAGQIAAEANTYLYTDRLNYRDDPKRTKTHSLTIRRTGSYPGETNLTGSVDEIRSLGQFLIEQADRFEAFGNTAADKAVSA